MKQKGFTLLETLIALVLMSLLLVALFGGFRAGIASWRAADSYIENNEPQLLLNRLLYRHMSQLQLKAEDDFWGEQAENLSFTGGPERMRYVAPLALAVDNQLYGIELASEPEGRKGVWIRYAPYLEQEDMQALLDEESFLQIADGLRMHFSYFVDKEWVDELPAGRVPELVRVNWQSDERTWAASTFLVTGA